MFYKLSTNLCFHYTTHAYFCQYFCNNSTLLQFAVNALGGCGGINGIKEEATLNYSADIRSLLFLFPYFL